jgi:hypothetical protein
LDNNGQENRFESDEETFNPIPEAEMRRDSSEGCSQNDS